jgi:hypothetical protein
MAAPAGLSPGGLSFLFRLEAEGIFLPLSNRATTACVVPIARATCSCVMAAPRTGKCKTRLLSWSCGRARALIGKRLTIGRLIPIIQNMPAYFAPTPMDPMTAALMPEAAPSAAAAPPLIAAAGAHGATLDVLCASLQRFPDPADTFPVQARSGRCSEPSTARPQHTGIAMQIDVGATEKGPKPRKFPDIFPVGREFDATRTTDGCGPTHPIRTRFVLLNPPQFLDRKRPSRHKHPRSAGSSGPARFVAAPGGFVHPGSPQQPMTSRSKEADPGPWA